MATVGEWKEAMRDHAALHGPDSLKELAKAIETLEGFTFFALEFRHLGLDTLKALLEIEHDKLQKGRRDTPTQKRGFRVTYEIVTPESAEMGEAAETGIEHEFVSMEPDEYDRAEGKTAVERAVDYLRDCTGEGGLEPSSAPGVLGHSDWWTSYQVHEDYETGEITHMGYHPVGFTEIEINQINAMI